MLNLNLSYRIERRSLRHVAMVAKFLEQTVDLQIYDSEENQDQFRFLRNCLLTPPLSQNFAFSEK